MPAARLIVGDCVEVMDSWPEGCVDLVVTSPPYDMLRNYRGFAFDSKAVIAALFRVIRPGGVVVWVIGDSIKKGSRTLTGYLHAFQFRRQGFNIHDIMIWQKKNPMYAQRRAYVSCFEYVLVCTRGAPDTFNPLRTPTVSGAVPFVAGARGRDGVLKSVRGMHNEEKVLTNIWEYAVGRGGTTRDDVAFEHPALFPEKLAADHIVSWSNPGDLVVDPMCGASTTGKMALMNGRRYVGIDVSEEYIDVSKRRLAEHGFRVPVRW